MKRATLVSWLDEYLDIHGFKDHSLNGVQVEGSDRVSRVACAVDTSVEGISRAEFQGAQMLFVHHGMFWGRPWRVRGHHKTRLKALLGADITLYAAHLPLDAHPEVGNNAVLIDGMGVSDPEPFGRLGKDPIGFAGELDEPLDVDGFSSRLEEVIGGPSRHIGNGPAEIRRIGVITGDAARSVEEAWQQGLDAFVTGEIDHASYHLPDELGIHLFFGGHYQTETLGPKAMADKLAATFPELETVFIDIPTGM